MERRGFLKGMLALGIAPAVITTPGLLMRVRATDIIDLTRCYDWPSEVEITGFGLAEVKAEGSLLTANHAKLLWPGIKKIWEEVYNEDIQITEAAKCKFDPETGLYLPE